MNLEKALTIQGWMEGAELLWLAEQASTRKRIAEIGSWKGRSTRAMADNLPEGGVIVAVDTWSGSDEEQHHSELTSQPDGWLFDEFKRNMEGLSLFKVQPFQMTSLEAARICKDTKFDMIFIDAAHDYENVKTDILAWKPLLAGGGLLCGHDYGGTWTGVTQAVDENVPGARIAAVTIWEMPL